ncbi:FecR family protein [Chitinophaga rhizosphaerae]|uniref:FecR family protein n=1 Tax=Chitinophaga rhizosphaerae TaxID=1864947 RepID=UPI000F7FC987|nr:FecR family protein [Chitinophaga rhizosphaerae]
MSNHPSDLEILLRNDDFVQWTLRPSAEGDARWEAWIGVDAERRVLVDRCRSAVLAVHAAESDIPADMLAGEIWEKMQGALRPKFRWMPYAAAAAVVLLLAGAGWWWMNGRPGGDGNMAMEAPAVVKGGNGEISAANNGAGLKTVLMVDGSRITLSPGAKVHFQSLPGPDARNVRLEGSAFFEVSPDPKRPFTVFAGKVVTRVLGTSFRISGGRSITVAVRSGKVSVSHAGDNSAWILLPNEQAVYDAGRNTMAKSVVINKTILENPVPPTPRFRFDETPAPVVIDELSGTYAVNIRYDRRLFEKCRITVSLEEGTFYDKLDVLCKVLGATYEIVNNEVRITGPGC